MKLERNCKICETPFTAIKTTQVFCRRKCFKKDYYLRNKAKSDALIENPSYPKRMCAFCDTLQIIPYDPVKMPEKFSRWECVNCGVTNEILWKYQDSPHSYQKIKAILTSVHIRPLALPVPENYTVKATFVTIITGVPQERLRQEVREPAVSQRNFIYSVTS